jgi:hypothetical protein
MNSEATISVMIFLDSSVCALHFEHNYFTYICRNESEIMARASNIDEDWNPDPHILNQPFSQMEN